MRRLWIRCRWLCSLVVVISSLGVALVASPGIALADASYSSCTDATNNFPSDLAAVGSGSTATFTFPANCTLDLTSSLVIAAGVDITITGNGLIFDGVSKTFDIIMISDTPGNPSSLTLDDVTITHGLNGITEHGGGTITVTNSTISDNNATGIDAGGGAGFSGRGGGVGGHGGDVILTSSTVSGNGGAGIVATGGAGGTGDPDSGGDGGDGGSVTLITSTVSNNGDDGIDVTGGIGGGGGRTGMGGNGGDGGSITLTSSTVSSNGLAGIVARSGPSGDGFDGHGFYGDFGSITLTATILAANGTRLGIRYNCASGNPPMTDNGYNLSNDTTCPLTDSHSHTNVTDLNLGTLGNYGGPTATIPLLPGSSAIDVIPTGTACPSGSTDQRGVPRPQGAQCDAGAYEVTTLATSTVPTAVSVDDTAVSVPLSATVTVPTCAIPDNDCGTVNQGTVTFHITDVGNNPVGTDVSGDVASGSAGASWTVPSGLVPGSYSITASYHDPSGVFSDSQGSNTLTFTAGPAASLSLSPGDTSATVGSSLTETASVTDAAGQPVANGTSVTFVVTGSNPTSYTTTTNNGQAAFTYSGSLTGTDTLTATANDGTTPAANATIIWTSPSSTPHAMLTIVNPRSPFVVAIARTGSNGGTPAGLFRYASRDVRLSEAQLTSLVVTGSTATLFGHAQLADGTPVDFRLDATGGRIVGRVRLRLSNGYDSGSSFALRVLIRP